MVHNVEFSCSHISFVWLHGLNSLQWWLLTCPDLTNVVWFKNNIDRHEYPKQLQAHPAKKSEIPDTRNTRWFWKKIGYGLGIAKNYRVGSGIGYPSGTGCGYQSTGEVISYYQIVVASTTDKMVSHKHIVVAATTGEMVSCISMGCQPPSTVWGAGRTFMRS